MFSDSKCNRALLAWSGERMIQYLVWEYFEKKVFEVYGEVPVGNKRIDLVCIKEDIVAGLEVKRKEKIEPDDISQIKRYVKSGFFSDLALLIQYKDANNNDITDKGIDFIYRDEFLNLPYEPAFLYVPIKEIEISPFYELDPKVSYFLRAMEYSEDSVAIFPSHLFEFEFDDLEKPEKNLKLTRDNETTIEYHLWKHFREKGACVLPQVNIRGLDEITKGDRMEIDLLVMDEEGYTAIEVKDNSEIRDEQIKFYQYLDESDEIDKVLFVVPQIHLKKASKRLSEHGITNIPVIAYEDILGYSVT